MGLIENPVPVTLLSWWVCPCVIMCPLQLQGCELGSSSERTRTAITAALKKKLKDIMGEFSALRQKLQLEYR